MPDSIVVNSPGALQRVNEAIKGLPIDGSMQVQIGKARQKRSLAQNRLLWNWHTAMAKYRNETVCDAVNPSSKEREHSRWKWAHVAAIYDRDGYPNCVKTPYGVPVRALREDIALVDFGSSVVFEAALLAFSEMYYPSSRLSVDQMTEALEGYDQAAQSLGCIFPRPEYDYYEAMGKRATL